MPTTTSDLRAIADKIRAGQRLSLEDGVRLYEWPDIHTLGELANMIAGNAKKDMAGLNTYISVPTVIIGVNHRLGRHQLGPWVVLECHCALGDFAIEVCLLEVTAMAHTGGDQ